MGLCEDDWELRSVVGRALRAEGFDVATAATGQEAIGRFSEEPPDILIIDAGLSGADGCDVCDALRADGVAAPVLFLTARVALTDRLAAFLAAGDDYLTKPFALGELISRVRALKSRGDDLPDPAPSADVPLLDRACHAMRTGENMIPLTPTEFRLLAALTSFPGQVMRRRELIAAAWSDGAAVRDNTLDSYIARLRRKLRELGAADEIITVHGVGYTLR